jgi:hypothetical protein
LALVTETPPETPPDALPEADLPEQLRIRRDKRDRLLAAGIPAYPVSVPRTTSRLSVIPTSMQSRVCDKRAVTGSLKASATAAAGSTSA